MNPNSNNVIWLALFVFLLTKKDHKDDEIITKSVRLSLVTVFFELFLGVIVFRFRVQGIIEISVMKFVFRFRINSIVRTS